VTLNNLAYAENLLGRYKAALRDIESAHELQPDDELVLLGRALTRFAVGQAEEAREDEAAALSRMTRYSAGYREAFFDNLRDGASHLAVAHPSPQHLDEYYRTLREAEASLDAIGTWKPKSTPARISDLEITGSRDHAVVSFDVSEIPAGTILSIRWYHAGKHSNPDCHILNGAGAERSM
jgi:tetratricopeptide (TPR) repeat protein